MEEEATALEHIMQNEKVALLVRKEKEATMGSIMEESRKLQKEAEENNLVMAADTRQILSVDFTVSSTHIRSLLFLHPLY
jgi:hypothetical protein